MSGAHSAKGKHRINSRRKGKDPKSGEPGLRRLLRDRDWQVFPRPRGEKGDDFTAIDPSGVSWSVECKNTVTLDKAHYVQCRDNCGGKPRMLAWHPSGWGFPAGAFIVIRWPKGGGVRVNLWEQKALCASTDSERGE